MRRRLATTTPSASWRGFTQIAGLIVLGFLMVASPTLSATSLLASEEETCAGGGLGVMRARINTNGAALASTDLSFVFDSEHLAVAQVFKSTFFTMGYDLLWSTLQVSPGQDTLAIEMFSGTPLSPGPDEELVWIGLRAIGAPGAYSLPPAGSTINDTLIDTLEGGTLSAVVADVALRIADDHAVTAGDIFDVAVVADSADNLSSFDLTLEYDPGALQLLGVKTATTTDSFFLVFNEVAPGEVSIAMFDLSGTPIPAGTGAVPVALVTFRAIGASPGGSLLDLTRGITNDGVTTCRDDGLVTICADNDGDLASSCSDCDDDDSDTFPGAPELCDGRDNQCPGDAGFGSIDEGFDPDGDLVASCFDNCPLAPNPDQLDDDGDGDGDVCDCAPADPSNPPASNVNNSVTGTRSGSTALLTWDDEGLDGEFLVYRGSRAIAEAFAYNHACLGAPLPEASIADADVPPSGEMFTYLIARRDACGESGLGTDSSGSPRPNGQACP